MRRSPSVSAVTAVAAALALAAPLSAMAARADTPAPVWTQRVCSAVVDWSTAAGVKEKQLEASIKPTSLKTTRAAFSRFMDQMVTETDRMITRIDAAGTPAVKSGAAIRQTLRGLLVRARAALVEARAKAAQLSLTDPSAFAKSAGEIGDAVSKQFNALGTGFDALDKNYPSAELDKAVTGSSACSKL